ncbi:DUF11 domain-containing protein [Candidatus Nomurabacteria bacterium]|nr:DUF11 domain-containing protein [Candidatus Nomurabacteria bacterium]
MNNSDIHFMNKYFKAIASAMAVFAFAFTVLANPVSLLAFDSSFGTGTSFGSGSSFGTGFGETPSYVTSTSGTSGASSESSSGSFTECHLTANTETVNTGDSVTLSWDTAGFNSWSINGQIVSGDKGSKTFTNIKENTTYTLTALNESGSSCIARVNVGCLPPPEVPKKCELEVTKAVNKSTAVVGDELKYTITVKNIGDADCTGSGVKIEDVLDSHLVYVSNQLSSNLSAGYGGNPVYTNTNRTLHFNGDVFTPGETGTISVFAKVATPEICGDFEVKNQAKATALELNNYQNWVYSPVVKTMVDNDCYVPKPPTCTLTPALQTISYGGTATLNWTSSNATAVNISSFGAVAQSGSKSTGALFADTNYLLTATGPDGEVKCNAQVKVSEKVIEKATVVAQKIICTDEAQLPNYGNGGPDITANTAANWVATHDTCSFAEGWEFEWTDTYTSDPGDTLIGKANSPWYAFGPTGSFGKTSVQINLSDKTREKVWFREVLKSGYIPFTYGQNGHTNVDNVSAEFYCHNDVINYDNHDYIDGLKADQTYYCVAWNSPVKVVTPAPSCDMFKATPSSILVGASSTLSWETTNATRVFINNGIGDVAVDGNIEVSPLSNITYKLTAMGADEKTVDCEVPVTVTEKKVPVCELFTATPSSLPAGGGDVTLNWKVLNASTVSISPIVGSVALVDSKVVGITESSNFVLTATDADGTKVTCPAPVVVADPEPALTCKDNVSFSISASSIKRGQSATLNWSTTDVDSVSISVINSSALSGTQSVSPSSDTTYVLKATRGSDSVSCPVSIDVTTGGGGGGGTPTPRCELTISDSKIKSGEKVTLIWNTSNATELTLTDDKGKVVFSTDQYLSSEKKDYYDGSIVLRPTRDTKYTLLAERGSRDVECNVSVKTEDNVVVLQTRDQQPLVAGISLSQVPYTGFEAGPIMTFMFYALLIAWAFYITYLLVIRKQASINSVVFTETAVKKVESEKVVETTPHNNYAAASTYASAPVYTEPSNLPTAAPVIGYANYATDSAVEAVEENVEEVVSEPETTNPHQATDAVVTALENRAHEQKALLSSDAIRYFMGNTTGEVERNEALDNVIKESKKHYPLEDGWIVINETRMRGLCDTCLANSVTEVEDPFIPSTIPEGSGSLAEAIVTGNIVAAYEMIGHRPMFALADAASDLDSVYRNRLGGNEIVSDMLTAEAAKLSDDQIKNMINALTSALDGTYNDEASAVKMAIMKAVKEVD